MKKKPPWAAASRLSSQGTFYGTITFITFATTTRHCPNPQSDEARPHFPSHFI
jgi:hypothetical protein